MLSSSTFFLSKTLLFAFILYLAGPGVDTIAQKDSQLSKEDAEHFYQIAMKEEYPNAPSGYTELQRLHAKAIYRKISLSEFEKQLEKNKERFRKIINFTPKGSHPLLSGSVNYLNHGNRNNRTREIIRLLLEYGADPNLKTGPPFYQPATHYMVMANDPETCRLFMKYGADPNATDATQRTAFQLAEERLPKTREITQCLNAYVSKK